MLARRGEIRTTVDDPDFNRVLREVTIWPVSRMIVKAIGQLDFRSDPADEIIASTSIAHDIPPHTRDMRILGSRIVPLAVR